MKRTTIGDDWRRVLYANPVVLVTSRSKDGVDNVAPYGMSMPVSMNPPMIALGVRPDRDTYRNILDSGEFSICLLTPALAEVCNITAQPFPPEVSEFDEAGLTRIAGARTNLSLVGESPAGIECTLEWHKHAGDHTVMIGRIMEIQVLDSKWKDDATQMRLGMPSFYRVGEHYFELGPEIPAGAQR